MGAVAGTRGNPWVLQTPGAAAAFTAYRDAALEPPSIVVKPGGAKSNAPAIRFHLRCLNDLDEMLKSRGSWMPLGSADEQAPAAEGTVEAWARSPKNPVTGWYGLTKGLRGRFADYIPPIMRSLNLAEIDEGGGSARMRSI